MDCAAATLRKLPRPSIRPQPRRIRLSASSRAARRLWPVVRPANEYADQADPHSRRAAHHAISESLAPGGCHRSTSGRSFIRGESSAQRVAHDGDGLSARYASRSSR